MEDKNKELHEVLKTMLKEFDTICRANGLNYSVFAGTLLGTIRHKGFIPWDDDIDVTMPRKDYNKLLSLPRSAFQAPYFLQTPVTDKGYHKGFARLRNSNTTEISGIDAAFNCNHGAFIDIFPMDSIPDNKELFYKQVRKLKLCVKLLHFGGRINGGVGDLGLSTPLKLAYRIIRPLYKINLITVEKVFNNYNRIASLYENQKTKRVGIICYSFDNKRFIYNTENYGNGYMDLPFDDIQVQVPKDYDAILKNSYGEYMIPVNEGTNHGDTIFDMNTPYCDYVKEHKQELMEFWIASRK